MRRQSLNDGWEVRPKANLFAEMTGAGAAWEPVTLPHDAMIGGERSADAGPANAYFPGGTWEYRRNIDGPGLDEDRAVVLDLEGVYRDAVVTVNGETVARRAYGYSRFTVAIDHFLRPGENELAIEASASHDDSRWYSGAGIHRDVWLLESGRVHLSASGLSIRTPEIDDEVAVVAVEAVVENETRGVVSPVIRIEIVDAAGSTVSVQESVVTCLPGKAAVAHRRLRVDSPTRWGPDDPYLYGCRVTLLDDEEFLDEDSTTFGIRSLALNARRGLRINGEPLLLRGACVHHDNGPLGAAAIGRADDRRIERLKAAGFNAVRSGHNPMSRTMLDACDRHGVLVMDETFDMWTRSKSDDDYASRFAQWWEADVEAMVRNAQNHPSVIMYSIGNEIPEGSTPTGLQIGRALAEKVRSLDDSRYVTQAVTGILVGGPELYESLRAGAPATPSQEEEEGVNTVAMTMIDVMQQVVLSPVVDSKTVEAFALLDVAGYNYMSSRYELDAELHPDRVVVGTETHPPAIADGWSKVQAIPNVIGDFTWTGWDYLGEVGIGRNDHGSPDPDAAPQAFHGEYPWRAAWCGDIDMVGNRRPQSFFREIVFGLRSDPYIAVLRPEHQGRSNRHPSPWAWNDVVASWSWPDHEGETVTVEIYAAADEVELLLDGESMGRQPAGAEHGFLAEFKVAYEPGLLEAAAWIGDVESGRTALQSASDVVRLELRPERDDVTSGFDDLAYVEVVLIDDGGVVHPALDRRVHIEVAGPGMLQGLGSADPASGESFTAERCSTFDGRALAIIRPTGPGEITVTATAEGCEPAAAAIEVRG